jgi:hypothetical protein
MIKIKSKKRILKYILLKIYQITLLKISFRKRKYFRELMMIGHMFFTFWNIFLIKFKHYLHKTI